ncbi:helix-turn-helix domain-containing protein [Inconstantimicrobium mannanitabidum]|uniref:Uncharacterized protein n=1 Tax=Inconstantimicrobium mannanitabidum TaxID=1604901 RepID=A0ACB5R8T5_9CLOT|nr:helix-turn-helix transcriptional regulator [Clostridium sp. TW13]GKX65603.1 hypothetical protein rsdtw13_08610 [Clostridium sp. TW13]
METRLKQIRKDLKIKQEELACQGLSRTAVSKLENGQNKLKRRQAIKLANKAVEVQRQKGIILDYAINSDFLMGIVACDVEEILANLDINNEKTIEEFENALRFIVPEEQKDMLMKANEKLGKDLYTSSSLIKTNCLKLIHLNLNSNERIDNFLLLIKSFYATGDYKNVIDTSKLIQYDIEIIKDEKKKLSYYYNLGVAYYEEKNYSKTLQILELIKKLKIKENIETVLTLEANTLTMLKKYDEALNIYCKIVRRTNDENLKANTYASITYIYTLLHHYKTAEKYIDKACANISNIRIWYKYNVLSNKMILQIAKKDTEENVFNTFADVAYLLSKMNNEKEVVKMYNYIFPFFSKSESYSYKILEIILKKCNLPIDVRMISNIVKSFSCDDKLRGLL